MNLRPDLKALCRSALIAGGMIAVLLAGAFASTASAGVEITPDAGLKWASASGFTLVGSCKPPRKQEGCVKDPCTGNYICCDKTSGGLSCRTLKPK